MGEASKFVLEIVKIRQAARDIVDADMEDIIKVLEDMPRIRVTDLTITMDAFGHLVHSETERRLNNAAVFGG